MKCVAIAQSQRMGPCHCEKIGLRHFPSAWAFSHHALLPLKFLSTATLTSATTRVITIFSCSHRRVYTVKSTTNGTLNFLAQTSTTSYLLNTNASYFKYLGPGAADAGSVTWGTPASATFSINHVATELTAFNFAASWTRADVATTNLAQTGVGHRQRLNQYFHRGWEA